MKSFIKIHKQDNVLLALRDIQKGERLHADGVSIEVKDDIKEYHKIALQSIKENDSIVKYGFPIGHASQDISMESIFMSIIRKQTCLISNYTAIHRDLMKIRILMRTGRLKVLEEKTEMRVYGMNCGLSQLSAVSME